MISLFHKTSHGRFILLLTGISLAYAFWLIACWPGVLGQDSLAILYEVDTGREFQANKPPLWYWYVLISYGPTRLVEIPIILQMIICAVVAARILEWLWHHGMYKSFWYCLIFIVLAPSVVYYASSLYSDGVYAVTTSGMLFEIWRSYRERRLGRVGGWMLFLTIPFALFSRPNGFISLFALLILAVYLRNKERWKLIAILFPWCVLAIIAQVQVKYRAPIGTIFPLALYETVGFLEERPMDLWEHGEPRVTPATIKALTSGGKKIDHIRRYYDHYYWDPLVFFPKGPSLLGLTKQAKDTIIKEFFFYNLWHNFPAFMASRVNIFLYAAFADGGFPGPTNAENILPLTQSKSELKFRDGATHRILTKWFDFSFKYRVIFWTPWVGIFLIFAGAFRSWRKKDGSGGLICATFLLHLFAVALFSIAGEYRYLLAFFVAPMVLLPALYSTDPA